MEVLTTARKPAVDKKKRVLFDENEDKDEDERRKNARKYV
jgi:hypothetical protein